MELGFLQDHGPHSGQRGLGGGARAERKPRFHSPSRGTCILLEDWHPFRIGPKWILLHESTVNPSACNSGDMGSISRSEDSLEKEVVMHSSIPSWTIPWTEETGALQSMELQRVRHD